MLCRHSRLLTGYSYLHLLFSIYERWSCMMDTLYSTWSLYWILSWNTKCYFLSSFYRLYSVLHGMSSPARSSTSENDEELGYLPLRLPARCEMYAFEPPVGATERRQILRLALSGGDENPTNEQFTSAVHVMQQLIRHYKYRIQWKKVWDCEKWCCFDVREKRDLMVFLKSPSLYTPASHLCVSIKMW